MCTGIFSHGEASQAANPQLKLKTEDPRRREVEDAEDDSARNTPDSDKVKKDAPKAFGQADSRLESLVPRALHADLGLGSGHDDLRVPNTTTVEDDFDCDLPDEGTANQDVEMQPTLEEENVADEEGDAAPSGGLECRQAEIQGDGSGLQVPDKLGESDQDRVVQELRAELAALKGQTPDSSTLTEQTESPSAPEPSQKGVVRNVPPFMVLQPDETGPVKTRSVADIPKPPATKVRTRRDGPATSVPSQQTRKKAQKRPKVDLPKLSSEVEDEGNVSYLGDAQALPAKSKRTSRR